MGYIVGILLIFLLFELARLFIGSLNSTSSNPISPTTSTPTLEASSTPLKPSASPKSAAPRRSTARPVKKGGGNSQDDLTKIEGIGPKIAKILGDSGLQTYTDLAQSDVSSLERVIRNGGVAFRQAVASTWAEQARLAAAGKWEVLGKLQDELKGGIRKS